MKTIYYNSTLAKLLLFKGYGTIMLFGFVLTKLNELKPSTIRHENIHRRQYIECTVLSLPIAGFLCWLVSWWFLLLIPVFYYLLYIGEWLVRLFMKGNAYRNICFEREAYTNQDYPIYLDERKWFAWCDYFWKGIN